jgi:Mg-chelatase subunit ChlD
LENLKEIFENNPKPIDTSAIDELLEKFKPLIKDVIFLVDISESMSGNKVVHAVKNILGVYEKHLNQQDRVGYILFNEKAHIIFSLTHKSHKDAYLHSLLEKIPV